MSTTPAVAYLSEHDVPISPNLLNEIEKALELSSRNTATPDVIPFFTPQAVIDPVTIAVPNLAPAYPQPYNISLSTEANLETVLSLGLPFFLVGFNVNALQTLAANPSLLASFKDANGVYKQPELINLVQTLTQNVPQASQPAMMPLYAPYNPVPTYQPSPAPFTLPPPVQQPGPGMRGYRGDQNLGDANLHLSGYGPTTTNDEIIAMFAPYVHVTEIVNKSGFSFVNTNDPEGARRAKEALNGSLLGGLPCRINPATRKARDPSFGTGITAPPRAGFGALPTDMLGQVDVSQVKDDRGNPATKNLFVAGYGPVSLHSVIFYNLPWFYLSTHRYFFDPGHDRATVERVLWTICRGGQHHNEKLVRIREYTRQGGRGRSPFGPRRTASQWRSP